MDENLAHGKKKIREQGYQKYDNFDAIEVPILDAIPSDYSGLMGVPITIFDGLDPDQFEVVGLFANGSFSKELGAKVAKSYDSSGKVQYSNHPIVNERSLFARVVIRVLDPS